MFTATGHCFCSVVSVGQGRSQRWLFGESLDETTDEEEKVKKKKELAGNVSGLLVLTLCFVLSHLQVHSTDYSARVAVAATFCLFTFPTIVFSCHCC